MGAKPRKKSVIVQVVVWHNADDATALGAVQTLVDAAVDSPLGEFASEDCPGLEICAFSVKKS